MKMGGGRGGKEDVRFQAASCRPQFFSRESCVHGDGSDERKRKEKSSSLSFDLGLGVSLTRAIESDDRFKSALAADPERFGFIPTRDKYGRKTKKKKKGRTKTIYGNDEEGEDDANSDKDVNDNGIDNMKDGGMEARIAYLNALSRGDVSASTSSSDDDSNDDDDDDNDESDEGDSDADADDDAVDDERDSDEELRGKSGIFDPNHSPLPGGAIDDENEATLTDEPSRYLCVLNLNWDRVRAVDVYAMLHSFCPPGTLCKVAVYPSDFGRLQMEKERIEGPPAGIWKKRRSGSRDGDDNDSDSASGDEGNDNFGSESSYHKEEQSGNESLNDEVFSDDDSSDDKDGEDTFNLAEATAGLYKHFPPQSTITKNSRQRNEYEDEEGFDVERLREYEASKLRYYFAIATFASSDAAARAYEGVDGLEMEDSATEIDVRILPEHAHLETIRDRHVRDEWSDAIPAKYVPPEDAQTAALRQSRVTCTWEKGDVERERLLTRHGMGKDAWEALATGDDIGFYLATSDNSSSGGTSDEDYDEEDAKWERNKRMTTTSTKKKKNNKRAMLGLEESESEDEDIGDDSELSDGKDDEYGGKSDESRNGGNKLELPHAKSESQSSEEVEDADNSDEGVWTKDFSNHQVTFMPGKQVLEGRIRSKLSGVDSGGLNGLSPYEKYLEKRKEKRRERRQAVRGARKKKDQGNDDGREKDSCNNDHDDYDGMYNIDPDPDFGVAKFSDEESSDDCAAGNKTSGGIASKDGKKSKMEKVKQHSKLDKNRIAHNDGADKVASTKEELELLIAGDDGEYTVDSFFLLNLVHSS